jgi:hypothetical protein
VPVRVKIDINGRVVSTIHIAREKGLPTPNSENTYRAIIKNESPSYNDLNDGVMFTHRYGDGVEICVKKAIEALEKNNKLKIEE